MDQPLDTKVALVTGAGRGIGRATALALGRAGVRVVLAARTGADVDAVAAELASDGHHSLAIAADITSAVQVASLVQAAVAEFGRLDILVNAAGIGSFRPFADLTEAELRAMLEVNVIGTFLVSQAVAAEMAHSGGGLIVNLPGTAGRAPLANGAAYCASKYALVGMSKAMALDLRRAGVRVTLLYLGGVDTPFWDTANMRVQREKLLSPDDAARAVLYAVQQPLPGVLSEIVLQPESHQV